MVKMKIYIAYESKYGNGRRCVEYLQNTLTKKGHDVKVSSIREIKSNILPEADLYIFSSPTHIGSIPRKMKKFLKKLEVKREGAKYALITTYLDPKTKTLQIMEDLLQPKGLNKVSDGLKIKVMSMKGPLEDDYEKKLDDFAKDICK